MKRVTWGFTVLVAIAALAWIAAPDGLREPLTRSANVLSTLIDSSTPARRGS